ncbi:DUF3999 family protein [Pseudomonas sp. F1_0610]|uniref:DUF3999 family protein n=1 Tax=Pseudomonas sp. F1_0610 TaxID=3114284 RepID=UPI0039C1F2E5
MKNKLIGLCYGLLILLCAGNLNAIAAKQQVVNNAKPMDFAYGRYLELDTEVQENTLVRLQLPVSVVDQLVFSDKRDLRIFNSNERALPMAILSNQGVYHYELARKHSLKQLPIHEGTVVLPTNQAVNVKPAIMRTADTKNFNLEAYFSTAEQRGYSGMLQKIQLQRDIKFADIAELSLFTKGKYSQKWEYRGSKNISLIPASNSYELSDFISYSLELMAGDDWLILWKEPVGISQQEGFDVLLVEKKRLPPVAAEYVPIELEKEPSEGYQAIYKLPGKGQDIGQLLLEIDEKMLLFVNVEVSFSGHPDDWVSIKSLVLDSRDKTQGTLLNVDRKNIQRIRLTAPKSAWNKAPKISREFYSPVVIFNRSGDEPYLLAWGAANVADASLNMDDLLCINCTNTAPIVSMVNAYLSNKAADLAGQQATEIKQPLFSGVQLNIWFWLIMVLSGCTLLFMSVKLIRESSNKTQE